MFVRKQLQDGGRFPEGTPWDHRFWRRVKIGDSDDCWLWTGKVNKGYGQVETRYPSAGHPRRTTTQAHRMAYYLTEGDIPDGLVLDHLCRNKQCCNPYHLEPVTPQQNSERAWFYRVTDTLIEKFRMEEAAAKQHRLPNETISSMQVCACPDSSSTAITCVPANAGKREENASQS